MTEELPHSELTHDSVRSAPRTAPGEWEESPDIHSSSTEYAARFAGPVGKWMLEKQTHSILRMLNGFDINSVLDIGGGHGQVCPALVERGYDVTVLGSSPHYPKFIAPFVETGTAKYEVGTLTALPYEDKSYDAVICIRQLCHLRDWENLIQEASRVARSVVILDFPPRKSFNILYLLFFPIKKWFEGNTRRYRTFDRKDISGVFQKAGRTQYMAEPQFFFPMVFHRACNSLPLSRFFENVCYRLGLTTLLGSPVIISYL